MTRAELEKVSVGLLTEEGTVTKEVALIRDRAMLHVSASVGMRGDNVRPMLFSDLLLREIPLVNMGHDTMVKVCQSLICSCWQFDLPQIFRVQALVIVSNQSKTNTNGHIDTQGVLRHRKPELCAIGALAMHFFALFHMNGVNPPNFEPDWSNSEASAVGDREWYRYLVFPGGLGPTKEMTADCESSIVLYMPGGGLS